MYSLIVEGIVISGLKEGSFFMSMDHYKEKIKDKFGFDAYPGTLNLKISSDKKNLFKKISSIKIPGFKKNNKTYGSIDCYKAKINGIIGSIIFPEFNKHGENIIEFIAPIHVKSELKIIDGDKIKVKILG